MLFTLPLNNGILFNNIGFLDTNGMATVVLSIPNLPFISGATVYAGFVVGDPQSLTGIGTISPALAITLQ